MEMLTRCLDSLKRSGIRYSHSIHRPAFTALDVASSERVPPHDIAKTVIYRGDLGYGMLVLPADCIADFDAVREIVGLSWARLASETELAELFPDCELGAMPPFGNLFNLPVLLDERLAGMEYIAFTAGTHRDAIRMSTRDFRKFVNPLIVAFSIQEQLV